MNIKKNVLYLPTSLNNHFVTVISFSLKSEMLSLKTLKTIKQT